DSIKIMAKRGEYPFKRSHVRKMVENTTLVSFRKRYPLGEAELQFYCAGHIAGAAFCDIDDGERRVVYSGDYKLEETRTTFPSELPPRHPDVLIMESTYYD
ncbi:MAG: hypothetical protein N3E51_03035, partial [Candidatus Micrarchaeota archaeon]|nr:hypothetical protein [Candidatus Micrarchaeota archaeon]